MKRRDWLKLGIIGAVGSLIPIPDDVENVSEYPKPCVFEPPDCDLLSEDLEFEYELFYDYGEGPISASKAKVIYKSDTQEWETHSLS